MSTKKFKWINNNDTKYYDNDFKELFIFYVINTPCTYVSDKNVDLETYGWNTEIWKSSRLKTTLYQVANLKRGFTSEITENLTELQEVYKNPLFADNFYKNRECERVAANIAYCKDKKFSEFVSICYHIRNCLAHGKFEIYKDGDELIYVMEDYSTRAKKVSARMVLKKSTLLKWMEILKSGKLPESNKTNKKKK